MLRAAARPLRAVTPLTATGAMRAIWGVGDPVGDSLIVPLPDLTEPTPTLTEPTPTKVTTLANGLKVASCDMATPFTTVGVYIETGSRYDTVPGTAHALQHMAFMSTTSKSQLMMVREAESMGAAVSCTAARENMVYQIDTLKGSVPEAVAMLAGTVTSPKLLPWEVQATGSIIAADITDAAANYMGAAQELMNTAAFGSTTPLGKALTAKPSAVGAIDADVLAGFVSEQMVPNKMVVAAAGYDHDELVALATTHFGGMAAGAPAAAGTDAYVGGEVRLSAEDYCSHFAIGFEGAGWKSKDLVPLCVLNTLMGGGSSFSAGGPGKGMYTRLYQNILNRYPYVQAANVFTSFYNDTGCAPAAFARHRHPCKARAVPAFGLAAVAPLWARGAVHVRMACPARCLTALPRHHLLAASSASTARRRPPRWAASSPPSSMRQRR